MTDNPHHRVQAVEPEAVARAYIQAIGAHLGLRLGAEDVNELREILEGASRALAALTIAGLEPSDDPFGFMQAIRPETPR